MMIEIDGKPINAGQTVTVDHVVQTYKIVVRSLSGVHADVVKDHLQKNGKSLILLALKKMITFGYHLLTTKYFAVPRNS